MDGDSKRVYYWWLFCAKGCTWEKTAMTSTADQAWAKQGCPTCGAAYVGQVLPSPTVA